jgi:hypothetical protein
MVALVLATSIPLRPLPRRLLKVFSVILVLVCNACLNRIIRVRLDQQVSCHVQHSRDLVRRLPLVCAQHAEAHGAFVIVGYVWVVDLGLEGENRRFERVV